VQLKPAYQGASINAATFLDDGRVALAMGLPGQAGDGMVKEAWIFDPATGTLTPFPSSANPRAGIVVVSPDGHRVAYARPVQSDSTQRKRLAEAGSTPRVRTRYATRPARTVVLPVPGPATMLSGPAAAVTAASGADGKPALSWHEIDRRLLFGFHAPDTRRQEVLSLLHGEGVLWRNLLDSE
jgi:hypothetical protein